jgi:hypothetical protein
LTKINSRTHATDTIGAVEQGVLALARGAADDRTVLFNSVAVPDAFGTAQSGSAARWHALDRRRPARTRAIIERSQRAFGHGSLDAALHGLMMQTQRPTDRKKRRVFPIGQQYSRALDPACRLDLALLVMPPRNGLRRRLRECANGCEPN